jgi:hypothetical protein
MERLLNFDILIFFAVLAGVAFLIRVIYGAVQGEGGGAVRVALETMAVAVLGSFIARTFISILMAAGSDSTDVGLVVGWSFFFPVGVIDSLIYLFKGESVLTRPDVLLWIAAGVGGFSGFMNGFWRVYDWDGLGVPAFLLDHTWGLSGTGIAALLHLINFAWAGHADETFDRRKNNHRYKSGFALARRFAFTQGNVMSNLSRDSSDDLWHHENLHVWQNRLFGPFFTITYVAWMAVMLIPALLVGLIGRHPVGKAIMAWCYYNNPWEVWAYSVGGWRDPFLAWGTLPVAIVAAVFYVSVLVGAGSIVAAVY